MRNLSMAGTPLEPEAVEQGLLHGVAQRVVGVERGVRADDHVRMRVQPREQVVASRGIAQVFVELPLLALDDIEGRSPDAAEVERAQQGIRYRSAHRDWC